MNQTISLKELEKKWTPNREGRLVNETRKIRSAREGPLRGGDWVLNESGRGATLSFTFLFEGEVYGLTVGHLADLGESIFIFAESTKLPVPLPEDDEAVTPPEEAFFMYELGTVVSKSEKTDSLVFKITNQFVPLAPYMTLAEASGVVGPLTLPSLEQSLPPFPPPKGTFLVGFGAQRRGSYGGVVSVPSLTAAGTAAFKGDIGISHPTDGMKKVTDPGDCGTIFTGLDSTPYYFHHCRSTNVYPSKSYGIPIWDVMGSHRELGGKTEEIHENTASPNTASSSLKEFKATKIISLSPTNNSTEENELPVLCGSDIARIRLPIDDEKSKPDTPSKP